MGTDLLTEADGVVTAAPRENRPDVADEEELDGRTSERRTIPSFEPKIKDSIIGKTWIISVLTGSEYRVESDSHKPDINNTVASIQAKPAGTNPGTQRYSFEIITMRTEVYQESLFGGKTSRIW